MDIDPRIHYLIGNYYFFVVISYITQKCTLIPSRLRGRGVEVFYQTLFYLFSLTNASIRLRASLILSSEYA